ncbi:MAG TPA: hypothetical protein VG734_10450 [Lacunisphaera sp.]|nr:hypothetical protein [Lacunisphaera sp.]
MSTDPANMQSATARRAAETQLRGLVTKFSPAHQRLVAATRRWLRQRLPTSIEIVYEYRDCFVVSFSPNHHGYEGIFALRGDANGLKLYFNRGKGMPDPEKLLQGKVGQTRWIPLVSASTLTHPPVVALVDQAIARNRVPFAPTGRGQVIVRSSATKPAGKRRAK